MPTVVIAVDPSVHSEYAVEYYMKNVHREGNTLEIIHVPEFWDDYGPMEGPTPGRLAELRQETAQITAQLETKFKEKLANVPFKFVPLKGKEAWEAIIEYANKQKASMIVIGTRGQGKVRRTLLGSVSGSVLHHADCPVLICRHPQHTSGETAMQQ